MNIYELPNDIIKALDEFYACFDQDTGELIKTEEELAIAQHNLEELQNKSNETMEWLLKSRANSLASIAGAQLEVERIQKKIDSEQKKIDRTENIIDMIFKKTYEGKASIFGNFKVSYKESEAVIIDDVTQLPKEYVVEETKVVTSYPKKAIKEAIESGKEVKWAHIEKRNNLQIK